MQENPVYDILDLNHSCTFDIQAKFPSTEHKAFMYRPDLISPALLSTCSSYKLLVPCLLC